MIAWLNPAALAGLALLAGPVLVHLLLRHRADRIQFPSLRFVRPSRTAAVRVRLPSDLALLLLRMAIVALAVVALARPLLLARPRLAAWNARIARAIVVDVSKSMQTSAAGRSEAAEAATAEGQAVVFVTRIDAPELRSGVLKAVERLADAPPGRREIVIVSDFQRGVLARPDLDSVPPGIGIRLVQVGAATKERTLHGLELFGANSPVQEIRLSGRATAVSVVPGSGPREGLRLIAADADSAARQALERTVASAGAPAASPKEPLTIVFAGGTGIDAVRDISTTWMLETVLRMRTDRDLSAACRDSGSPSLAPRPPERSGTAWFVLCRDPQDRPVVRAAAAGPQLVLAVEAPPSALLSAAVVRAALIARRGSVARPEEEVQTMTAAELTAWSRQVPPVVAGAWRSARPGMDVSDSRWCWALALVLLAVEAAVRSRKTGPRRSGAPHEVRAHAA